MSDPIRLSNPRSKSPASLRRLLRAGRSEMPDPERLRAVAVRLGFATVAAPATPGLAAKSSAVGGLSIAGSGSAKIGAVVVLVLAAGGGLLASRDRAGPMTGVASPTAPPSAEIAPLSPSVADPAIAPAPPAEEVAPARPSVSIGPASPVVRIPPGAARHAASASPSSAPGVAPAASFVVAPPAVETEAGLVQQARQALADNPARALDLADRADDRFPSGGLVQEREVVAIEALVALGRHDDARARAGHFLRRFPGSVHQRHIEALLGFDMGAREP